MKLKLLTHPGVIFYMTVSVLAIIAYLPKQEKKNIKPPSHYEKYITAFTGGEISKKSNIVVRFVDEMVKPASLNMNYSEYESPFEFTPEIYGNIRWTDTRTLEFDPNYQLDENQIYEAKLNLENIVPGIPDSLKEFHFKFKTKKQAYSINIANPIAMDPSKPYWQKIEGVIKAADETSRYRVEEFITAFKDGEELKITWAPISEGTEFSFSIDSLLRNNDPYNVSISWNNYDRTFKGSKSITVPALGDFAHVNTTNQSYPNQSVVLEFSDPVKADQVLDGLIRIGDVDSRFDIQENKIFVYPKERLLGNISVTIEAGIENIHGHKLQKKTSTTVSFEEIYPQVRSVGKGTILPFSNILPFEFEAVNLSAVDIRVIKIAEKNIPQFLQINELEESGELKRVGSLLLNKKIDLRKEKNMDLKNWNKHVIDLSKMVKTEPGGIYQVAIGFRKSYSLYACEDTTKDDSESMLKLSEYWSEPGYNYDDSYENDRWDYEQNNENYEDADNPCKKSYYNSDRVFARNVLASNFGLVAKRGSEGSMFVAVTDLLTTAPISNVDLELYDYQQQLLSSAKTVNGIARMNVKSQPFLLIAKLGKQRGYLKVDNSSSITLSRFDIGGKEYHKGMKGIIYGERDVWRPGDSLYINFVLEDKLHSLPANHPVIFEMYNPQQELVQRIVKKTSLNNLYTFHTATSADAATGNYYLKVIAGGATFDKTIKIETIIPNRLKINLDWGTKAIHGTSESLKGMLTAKWLHGAPAQNLDATISMSLVEVPTTFKNYSEYIFTDQSRKFESERKEIFKGKVNEKGMAELQAEISAEGTAPGMLKANFKTKVFEPGGNFSSDYFSIPFHPFETYVGIKTPEGYAGSNVLLTDKDHNIKIVTLDTEGKPVSNKKVIVKLFKISWKWWWETTDEYEYSYNGKDYSEPILVDTIVTKVGEASWKLKIKNNNWGRYMIRVTEEGGHCAAGIFYADSPGWIGRAQQENPEGAKMLTFSTDKEVYSTGETITLNIPTGFSGRALLSLESSRNVIGSYWVEAQKGMTQFKFPATKDMAPNVYAHITLLQPHAQTVNDLPIRMYGIVPIRVEDPASHLYPVISMADQVKPEQDVAIHINEKNGRAMTYTIAVVDEGLLDLTKYKMPDIWSNFNERQALDVKTWDLYDDVAGASAINMKNLLSIGGDGSRGPMDGAKANRFKPVVKFLGPYYIGSGENKTHHFKMPNYVGSVKTMVIAAHNGAYGNAEKVTAVKKPLMVLGTLPRVLGPNEELNFPVTLFAMEKFVKNVSVKIEASELIALSSAPITELVFTEPREKLIAFPMKVQKNIGIAKIKVTAKSGNEIAVYETEIEIRNPNPEVENVFETTLDAGNNWSQNILPVGMKGTNRKILEISSIPPLNLGKRLEYLIHYPYGCVEQTTSSVFPQVCLNGLLNLSQAQRNEVDKNIRAGIARLRTFQLSDGSLSYWPGDNETNEWGTCYAGHFMLEAEIAGYTLPFGFKDKWKEYLKRTARNYSEGDELTQAYRLYLLALAKYPELGAMNRMRISKTQSSTTKWLLAAAYHLAGQPEVAKEMVKVAPMVVKDYKDLSNTFGSDERDKAIILQTLSIMGEKMRGASLVKELSNALNSKEYMNTQATAYSLIAIAKFTGKNNVSSEMKFAYKLNNGQLKTVSSKRPIWEEIVKNDDAQTVEIQNSGSGILFVKIVSKGIPEEGDKTDASNQLVLDITYKTMDGKPLNPSSIVQGTDFMAAVTVFNPGLRGDYEQMSLSQIFPSGWEIHNSRMNGDEIKNSSAPDYQNFRDDRVYTFFDLKKLEKKTFIILLNASYEGKFYLPTIYSEAMYDNSISARKHGQWVTVTNNKNIQ